MLNHETNVLRMVDALEFLLGLFYGIFKTFHPDLGHGLTHHVLRDPRDLEHFFYCFPPITVSLLRLVRALLRGTLLDLAHDARALLADGRRLLHLLPLFRESGMKTVLLGRIFCVDVNPLAVPALVSARILVRPPLLAGGVRGVARVRRRGLNMACNRGSARLFNQDDQLWVRGLFDLL